MSDWFLTPMSIAVVIYFLLNPVQFTYVLNWIGGFLHQPRGVFGRRLSAGQNRAPI